MCYCDPRWHNLANAFWTVTITITTVGYGDFFPVSHLGRLTATVAVLAFTVLISLMVAVVTEATAMREPEERVFKCVSSMRCLSLCLVVSWCLCAWCVSVCLVCLSASGICLGLLVVCLVVLAASLFFVRSVVGCGCPARGSVAVSVVVFVDQPPPEYPFAPSPRPTRAAHRAHTTVCHPISSGTRSSAPSSASCSTSRRASSPRRCAPTEPASGC